MASALDVAKYFLRFSDEESGDLISNLKLQKLIYYAQGFHLALFDRPLFDEPVEAWQHGPVVPDVYHAYKEHGGQGIPPPIESDFSCFTNEQKEVLDEVYAVYGQFSAWKLRNMTHEESPWRDTPSNMVITPERMKAFFDDKIHR
jgi:uncharacterized phage-associated protein